MSKIVAPLNARQISAWKPDQIKTLEKVDGLVPGLRVRLSPRGALRWSLSVMVDGKRRRIALGGGKPMSLAEARKVGNEIRHKIASGEDPTAAKFASKRRRTDAALGVKTLQSVLATFYDEGPGAALRSEKAARALLERVFADHLARASLDITPAELQLCADRWQSRSSAARVIAYFRPLARWASKRDLLGKGFSELEVPTSLENDFRRQRVLSQQEITTLLQSLGFESHDIAARVMLLTGARREEICGAKWGEFDLSAGFWTIPGVRRKDTRTLPARRRSPASDHILPLSEETRFLLARLRIGKEDEIVFTGERGATLGNWARWSRRIKRLTGLEGVTPHTLRRTCATLAGEIGAPPHVISALLGHRSIGGNLIAGYNKARYPAEVREVLQRIGKLIKSLDLRNEDAFTSGANR
jgi:integrase